MKNVIFFFCLLIMLSCKVNTNTESIFAQIPESELNSQTNYNSNLPAEPYELKLNTHQLSNTIYDLEITILLYNDAYYASSNAKKDLKGKFTFFIESNDSFILKKNLTETPLTNKKYISSTNDKGLTSWIGVDTSYKQNIEITTQEDFQVNGYIQFTIEPRCTFENIPIIISYKKDFLKFEIIK
uniref:hypothetical protein n=1 Tax=Flavobacterium sp. TaxID=239 RepID=UPI00404A32C4